MTLSAYIEDIGIKKFAELYNMSESHAHNLKSMIHAPEPKLAYKIVKRTDGLVSWAEIYEPHFEAKRKDSAQLEFDFE